MRFRQGNRVPENVYDTDAQPHKPIMIAPTPELAAEYVRLLNEGVKVVRRESAPFVFDGES